jgi:hypothetical protein
MVESLANGFGVCYAFKGARQLVWSRGLKDLFGLRDKSDEEILEETTQDAKQIDTVADMVFSLLVKYKNWLNI